MSAKKATAKAKAKVRKQSAEPVRYVLKDKWLQVTVDGKPFALDNTHPTFKRMAKALLAKNWKAIPKLVTLAQSLFDVSAGNITVKGGQVAYKGSPIHNAFTKRLMEMIKEQKEIKHWLLFLDDLFQNPSPEARNEFGDWMLNNGLPITDDGGFIAYKSVDGNLKDQHTHKIDNSPGQRILGSRTWFDTNYRTQCSSGYHICSKQYGLYGSRVMAVKAFPRDVLSAVGGKIRVVNYEVLKELGRPSEDLFKLRGYEELEKKLVVEIAAERKELLAMILASPVVKRLIRNKKIKKETIQKSSYARLKVMAQKHGAIPEVVNPKTEKMPPLQAARSAAGLTVGQVAKQMGCTYKEVSTLEKSSTPQSDFRDEMLKAIAALKGVKNLGSSAVTYPVPVGAR